MNRLLAILLLFVGCSWLFADQPTPMLRQFRNFDMQDGLVNNTVWTLCKDRTGFIWMGTNEGLMRFDGYTFKTYRHDPEDPDSISDNVIREIYEDQQGFLWLGTSYGLNRFDPTTGKAVRYYRDENDPASLSFNYITAIIESKQNHIWVATRDGLNRFNQETGKFERFNDPLIVGSEKKSNHIRALLLDEDDSSIWLGSEQGLYRYLPDGQSFEHYFATGTPEFGRERQIRALAKDTQGTLWVGTVGGLFFLRDGSLDLVPFQDGPASARLDGEWINDIVVDAYGYVWISSRAGGIGRIDPKTMTVVNFRFDPALEHGLQSDNVISLYVDGDDLLWYGTFFHGTGYLDLRAPKFATLDIRTEMNLPISEVLSIHESEPGVVWVGTQKGLYRYEVETGLTRYFEHDSNDPGSIPENAIQSIGNDRMGNLWIGTYYGGLARYDRERDLFVQYPANQDTGKGLIGALVGQIYLDDNNVMWVGTDQGLNIYRLEEDRFESLPLPDALTAHQRELSISSLYKDSSGELWVGTMEGGVCQMGANGQFRRFRYNPSSANSLIDDTIHFLTEDSLGRLLVGTTSGLNRISEDRKVVSFMGDRFPEMRNAIYAIIPAENGAFWASTSQGIVHYDPMRSPEVRAFTIQDGLQGMGFNPRASAVLKSGVHLFAGYDGVTMFHPDRMGSEAYNVPIVLDQVKVQDRPKLFEKDPAFVESMVFAPAENFFSLEFAALDYRAPERVQYSYRMQGFDSDWVHLNDRRYAAYTNLPAGDYRFQVRASNVEGLLNQRELDLPITILPAWHETLIFKIAMVLLIALAVWLVIFMRTRLARRRNELLQKSVAAKREELEETKLRLLETAHQAGIFEMAHIVINQVSTQLRTIRDAVTDIRETVNRSAIEDLRSFNRMFEKAAEQGQPLTEDQAQLIAQGMLEFEPRYETERERIKEAAFALFEKVEIMKDTIALQHQYATKPLYRQKVRVEQLVGDALRLESESIRKFKIDVVIDLPENLVIQAPRIKLLYVLTHIFSNSVHALESTEGKRFIHVSWVKLGDDKAQLVIRDTGTGIDTQHLEDIFKAGFSTKSGRSGLGLHEAVNAMREMEGDLNIRSAGLGKGTTVILIIPV